MGKLYARIFELRLIFVEYENGRMFAKTRDKEIERIFDEIKAEALQEAYNDGIAVPNELNALQEALSQ